MKGLFRELYCVVIIWIIYTDFTYAQQSGDYGSSVSSFKNKYPGSQVVAIDLKEEYSFGINSDKNSDTKVTADASVSQTLVPLKDYITNSDAVFYDQQSAVNGVHAVSNKTKSITIGQQCMDYQSDGIFYSDAKVCVFTVPLEAKGTAVNYSYTKHYKDVKYLTS